MTAPGENAGESGDATLVSAVAERRPAPERGVREESGAPAPGAAERLLAEANALAATIDPAVVPRAEDVRDLLCLVVRTVVGEAQPAELKRAGIAVEVDPNGVRMQIPISAGVDGVRFAIGWLDLEFELHPDTQIDVQRILVPANESDSDRSPAFSAGFPTTSAVAIDFGEWRLGDWSWYLEDGWFGERSLSDLTFAYRRSEPGSLDVTRLERDCLTRENLLAWAASLPWFGAVPPAFDVESDLSRLFAAAEHVATKLDPALVATLAEIVELLCLATDALAPPNGAAELDEVGIGIRTVEHGVELRLPVRAGLTRPDFRAAFLALRLTPARGTILVWRELVPALERPAQHDGEPDPRFDGEEPVSSWMELDLEDGTMSLGDLLLESRHAHDWERHTRDGYDEIPLFLSSPCLDPERLSAWVHALATAARATR